MLTKETKTLSHRFVELENLAQKGDISLQDLLTNLENKDQAFLTLILSLPFLTPIPLPGVSVAFGIVILFLGIRMCLGLPLSLPSRYREKKIPGHVLKKMSHWGFRTSLHIEKLLRPAKKKGFTSKTSKITYLCIALCGFLLALPFPPGTNFPPGIALFVLSIGVLESDSRATAIGYFLVLANIAFFSAIIVYGFEGMVWLTKYFIS